MRAIRPTFLLLLFIFVSNCSVSVFGYCPSFKFRRPANQQKSLFQRERALEHHPSIYSDGFNNIEKVKIKSALVEKRKREWINKSLNYYSSVTREEERKARGQVCSYSDNIQQEDGSKVSIATKLYYARYKIKYGNLNHAESIYRKIIDELLLEDDTCDHTNLAISTLLLALLLQRMGHVKETRKTFIRFFRIVMEEMMNDVLIECTCSAKVLQAFALFEMKQKNPRKSLFIVKKAVTMDKKLVPVLKWKQFRDIEID